MPHEHVVCDISRHSGKDDNRLDDPRLCIEEVKAYKAAGGDALVDVTCEDIGRDAAALQQVSKATGVHIITTTGYYAESIYPAYVSEMDTAALTSHMVDEATNGIDGTGIRPGIIGELGAVGPAVTAEEEKVLRAAARTHHETGLAVSLHSAYNRPGPQQTAILADEGVSLERVIVGHADLEWRDDMHQDLDYFLQLLDQGCTLGFDMIGWTEFTPETERIRRIVALVEQGYAEQLVLSSDLCRRSFYHANGGRGYDYVLREFVPRLRESSISDEALHQMLRKNPMRLLAF